MKRIQVMMSAVLLLLTGHYVSSQTQSPSHRAFSPTELQWGTGPAALPPGAQAAILEGDPKKPGIFTMRLKAPAGYRIMPHSHPRQERVTIISGAFKIGMGEKWEDSRMKTLSAGSYVTIDPNHNHFAGTDGETIIQLTGEGPWEVKYVNQGDDPRKAK